MFIVLRCYLFKKVKFMAKKFYAIRKGHKTGIFTETWKQIEKKYIKGYSNPEFKGFNNRQEAEEYLNKPLVKKTRRIKKENLVNEVSTKIPKKRKEISPMELEKKRRQDLREAILYSSERHKQLKCMELAIVGEQRMYQFHLIDFSTGEKVNINKTFTENITTNTVIDLGILDAINRINEPCVLVVYTKTHFGIETMINRKESANLHLLKEIEQLLVQKSIVLKEIVDKQLVYEKLGVLKNKPVYISIKNHVPTQLDIELRNVLIYSTGGANTAVQERYGYYKTVLVDKKTGKVKKIKGKAQGTTPNRMIITGIIEAVKKLKNPCELTIYTKDNCGFKRMNTGKGINGDLLLELYNELSQGNHLWTFKVDSDKVTEQISKWFESNVVNIN